MRCGTSRTDWTRWWRFLQTRGSRFFFFIVFLTKFLFFTFFIFCDVFDLDHIFFFQNFHSLKLKFFKTFFSGFCHTSSWWLCWRLRYVFFFFETLATFCFDNEKNIFFYSKIANSKSFSYYFEKNSKMFLHQKTFWIELFNSISILFYLMRLCV